jgi:hypothetical protein
VAAALLLLFAGFLPRLRRVGRGRGAAAAELGRYGPVALGAETDPIASVENEVMTIEAAGYTGALAAIALTIGSSAHTAAVLTALGAVLGLAAARPGRAGIQRVYLIIAASVSELIAIWLLLAIVRVALPEAYTLPFALLALITGLIFLKRKPDLGSWVAYGPALVAGFGPSLAITLASDSPPLRRVLLIVAGVAAVAIGALRRQKAPVVVGAVVTVIATLHELILLAKSLPWPILLVLFAGAGVLLVGLGATYEQRRRLERLRGAIRGMR